MHHQRARCGIWLYFVGGKGKSSRAGNYLTGRVESGEVERAIELIVSGFKYQSCFVVGAVDRNRHKGAVFGLSNNNVVRDNVSALDGQVFVGLIGQVQREINTLNRNQRSVSARLP